MRARRLCLAAVAALGAAAAWSAELTDLPPPGGAGVERGVALLRCTNDDSGLSAWSRATILDTGAISRGDVLLTTAHGLPSSPERVVRDCRVLARGKEHAIERVWHAGSDGAGPEHDWAVLVTQRIAGDVRRWPAAEADPSWLDSLVTANARVRLVMRYADAARSDCRLEAWTPQRLLAHSCVTYPGTSGSPLVVGVEHEPVLIGLHLGSQATWNGKELDIASVARPLDAGVLAAIEAAAAVLPQLPKRRR